MLAVTNDSFLVTDAELPKLTEEGDKLLGVVADDFIATCSVSLRRSDTPKPVAQIDGEKSGSRINETGVIWNDDRSSRVRITIDAPAMLRDVLKIRWNLLRS